MANQQRKKALIQRKKEKQKNRSCWILYTVLGSIIIPGMVILFKAIQGYTIRSSDVMADYVLMVYALLINLFWCGIANLFKKEKSKVVASSIFAFFAIIFSVGTYFSYLSPTSTTDMTANDRWFWILLCAMTVVWVVDLTLHSKIEKDSFEP